MQKNMLESTTIQSFVWMAESDDFQWKNYL
jgi:hypothetical protein